MEDFGMETQLLTNTEILEIGEKTEKWRQVGHLPNPLQGLRGVSLDNNILMTGIV